MALVPSRWRAETALKWHLLRREKADVETLAAPMQETLLHVEITAPCTAQ